ncbi:MAG: MEDS domain-containing protein [Candidatus Bathyarchaeota archaeon]|nr:MEDS domain-containing protein [Candidatus Bathyarchaeota archaeon]MDH5688065.1 MEDS domain-containing protein [Candidatus Bathyarchaeota archaeon]
MSVTQEVVHFVNSMKAKDHVILFYDTLKEKHNVLFNFLSASLSNGKGAVYVCFEESPEEIRNAMKLFGIDVRKNEEEGNLIISNYDEVYIENGQADCLKILAIWKEIYERFRKRGLGLSAVGEMSCFFIHNKVRELLRYEYALHRFLDLSRDGICAYNVNTIVETGYTEIMMPLVRAHGWAIFTGPSGSMVYKPENVEDYDVERLLKIRI